MWLVLWRLGLPLDDLDGVAERELSRADQAAIEALVEQRIATRKPAAYLTGEAWLQGLPFHVDERVIVPRSLIAELLAEGTLDAWLVAGTAACARPVHRQRQPGGAGRAGLARARRSMPPICRPTRWTWRGATSSGMGSPSASACARATAWPRPRAATT